MDQKNVLVVVAIIIIIALIYYCMKEGFASSIYTAGATQRHMSELSSTNQEYDPSKYNMFRYSQEILDDNEVINNMKKEAIREGEIISEDPDGLKHNPRRYSQGVENFATDSLASTVQESILKDKLLTEQGKSGFDVLLQKELY